MTEEAPIEIARLGARGDGIAETPAGQVYVPFALPGETWSTAPHRLIGRSRERAHPICRHFGTCGGCVAQHMPATLYAEWKRGIVADAFAHRGLDADVAPLVEIPPRSRRRAVLTAERRARRVILGYREQGSHALVDLEECPVLVPAIVDACDGLREIAAEIVTEGSPARLTVLAAPAGLDVAIDTGERAPSPARLLTLAGLAERHRLLRLSLDASTIVTRAPVRLSVGGVEVEPAPGAFLQAVREAEDAMSAMVCDAISGAKARHVADLFSGLGTFTFALARHARVLAVDSDRAALATLRTAARRAQGLKPIETRVRDLFREPLSRTELASYDAVVFDPPRAGAPAQAKALARSTVGTVAAVSCNPATLARDVRALVDGGYRLERVVPIDQFVHSSHVEAVAVLRR